MKFFNYSLTLILGSLFIFTSCQEPKKETSKPNVVLIFLDDGGFADFKPFGEPRYPTPHVETLAREGRSYHNFYVPQAICSASRAALLTGCYPGRTKVFSAHAPRERGLDTTFMTMGEVFQREGYQTAVFGKWHIGDQEDTRPNARGFSESAGLMYSNDMWKHHPGNPEFWSQWPLQYWDNGEIVIDSVNIIIHPTIFHIIPVLIITFDWNLFFRE